MAGYSASIINHFYIGYTEETLLFYNADKTDFTDYTLIIEHFAYIIKTQKFCFKQWICPKQILFL